MYIPVFTLSDIAQGKNVGAYAAPSDLMKRVLLWTGRVDLGYDVWQQIASIFGTQSVLTPGSEFDVLYLSDDYELDAIKECREALRGLSRDNPDRRVWLETKKALLQMRATRLALGLDGADWNLG